MFGIDVRVYMVRVSYEQKPFRRSMMHSWGAEVLASPTDQTESGRKILDRHPDSPGSLGIAISEAVEEAASREDTNIAEALNCKHNGEARTLFFNLSGHGHFDMASYDKFFSKELEDYEYPEEAIEEALHHLPQVAGG